MAITKVINDAVNLNQTSDYSGLKLPVGTTEQQGLTFNVDYLIAAGGGGGGMANSASTIGTGGGGGAGGFITSYNNSSTTTNTINFPTGKTAIATYMLNGNATDVSGTYSGTANSYVSYNTGQYGGGAIFNGTSSYIDLPAGLAPPIRTAAKFAVSLWFKRDGNQINSYGGRLIQLLNDIYININLQTDNTVKALVVTSTPSYPETVTGVVADNTWNHIVFTGDSNGIKLYLNKSLADSDSWDGTFMTYTNSNYKFNRIGYSGAGVSYYTGEIDQIRIYSDVLDQTDVDNIYNNEAQINSGGGTAAASTLALTGGTNYTVTVGEGGAGGVYGLSYPTSGSNSVFYNITSTGGGRGASYGAPGLNAASGGSGGGAAYSYSLGAGTAGQGYSGGNNLQNAYGYGNGGGGGAAALGGDATTTNSGSGGIGVISSILNATNATASYVGQVSGGNIYYAGGGGGGVVSGYGTGPGGLGGGGAGGIGVNNNGVSGLYNTGGGGGGAGKNAQSGGVSADGGAGGAGVVILRYATADVTSFTTSGTLITPSTTDTLASTTYPITNLAYYKLDGDVSDATGSYDGNLSGSTAFINGIYNQGIEFKTDTSYIDTGISPSTLGSSFALSCWVYFKQNSNTALGDYYAISGAYQAASGGNQAWIFYNWGGTLTFFTNLSAGGGIYVTSGTISLNQWHHVVFSVEDQTEINVYLDNVKTTSSISSSVLSNNVNLYLGALDARVSNRGMLGLMDQVRIFNTNLTDANVTDLYNEHYRTLYTEGSDTVLIFNKGTGNINFTQAGSGPPVGSIRTNTDLSPGSANSGLEVFNGTEFKTFSATLS